MTDAVRAGPAAGASWPARILRAAALFVATVHVALSYAPWIFSPPDASLESSWMQVVTHAAASGWQWGTDIAWTYGPLGFAWSAIYFEPLLAQVFFIKIVFVAALAFGLIGILGRVPALWVLVLYALVAFAGSMLGPGFYSIIPLLAALNHFRDPGEPRLRWVVPLVAASGVLALTYGPSGVLSFALFLLMDLGRLRRRRLPIFVPLMLGAALAGFVAAGQSLSSLSHYLRSVFELIAGYADAMSVSGRPWELAAFVALGLTSAALVVACEIRPLRDPERRWDSALLVSCLFVYWFVAFKSGFVRHDIHSLWAWAGLTIGLAAYVAIRRDAWPRWIVPMWVLIVVAALSCLVEATLFQRSDRLASVATYARSVFMVVPAASLAEGRAVLTDTGVWRRAMRERRDAARLAVESTYAELRLHGTVDMIGSAQGALLLQDVAFRTRPVFQDFAAYTPWLIELNRSHLRSPRAAETILLSTETIDNRYPMMDRGNAVLELLAHYRPERIAAGYLLLRRRSAPLPLTLAPADARAAAWGQWVDVAAAAAPLILKADIRPSALGRLARLFFRSPRVELTVRLADGTERTHRIVPAYGRDGMLLSPYVDGIVSYAAMALGASEATSSQRVVAFRMDTVGAFARAMFDDEIGVRVSSVRAPLAEEPRGGSDFGRLLERRLTAYRIANSLTPPNPLLSARDTLLLAHPPIAASLPVASARELQVTYGISDGAWKDGGATDGVCFRIFAAGATGDRIRLHERCLRPVERVEDRGEHRISLPLTLERPGTLTFETDCGGNCSWDWAYWKDIDITP